MSRPVYMGVSGPSGALRWGLWAVTEGQSDGTAGRTSHCPRKVAQELLPAQSALEWPVHGSAMPTAADDCIARFHWGKETPLNMPFLLPR